MSEHQGKGSVWLFSGLGLVVIIAILIVLNWTSGFLGAKADFTEHKLYTLSDGTKNILKRLDTPIEVRFYATEDRDLMPPYLREYAKDIETLLLEYKDHAPKGMFELSTYNPEPDTDDEDNARLNGIRPRAVGRSDAVYLGISVTMLDKKVAIPFLSPSRDQLLEYDLSRAIVEVTKTKKPVLGLMTGLPMAGGPQLPPQMQQGGAQRPWFIYNDLKRDYEVRDLSLTTTKKIDDDIDLLLVVHPNGINEEAEYAIDQYVLGGGQMIAFLDPFSAVAAASQQGRPNPMQPASGQSSDLKKLLPAWGLEFESVQVMADPKYRQQTGPNEFNPGVLNIGKDAINQDDIVTNQVADLLFYLPGAFYGEPKEGLDMDVLVNTSTEAGTVSGHELQFSPSRANIDSAGKEHPLMLRLTGTFKTAFPDGNPANKDDEDDSENEEADEDEEKEDGEEAKEGEEDGDEKEKDDSLKESQKPSAVVLVADSDMLFDQLIIQRTIFGVQPLNSNLSVAQNLIEHLSGDTDLIAVRSRGSTRRPFTTFDDMRRKAEEKRRDQLKDLEEAMEEAQRKLNELQAQKSEGQQFILSPEQQSELEKFEKQRAENAKKRRAIQKEVRKEITSKKTMIQTVNILGIPLLVAMLGVSHAIRRRARTSAR